MRRTKTFKDPASSSKVQKGADFDEKLESLPTHKLNMILTPLIVKNEEEAISRIANRIISEETQLEDMERIWK